MSPAKPAVMRKAEPDQGLLSLGLNLAMVDYPIPAPIIARVGRKGQGIYQQVLSAVSKMRATTMEMGLAPHYEWPCDSHKQLRTRVMGLQAAKRKAKEHLSRVFFMQRANAAENKFTIYLWNEGQ